MYMKTRIIGDLKGRGSEILPRLAESFGFGDIGLDFENENDFSRELAALISSSNGGASVQISVDGVTTENIGAFPPRIVPYFHLLIRTGETAHITVEQTFGAHQPFDLANQLRPNYPTHLHSDEKRRSELPTWFRLAVDTVGYNISQAYLDAITAGDEEELSQNHFSEMLAHTARIQCVGITLRNPDGSESTYFPDRPYDKHFHLEALPEKPGWWGVVKVGDASPAVSSTIIPDWTAGSQDGSRESTPLSPLSSPSLTDVNYGSLDTDLDAGTSNLDNFDFASMDIDNSERDTGGTRYGVIKIRPTFDWSTAKREILPVLAGIEPIPGVSRRVLDPTIIETQMGRGRITHRGYFKEIAEGVFSANPVDHRIQYDSLKPRSAYKPEPGLSLREFSIVLTGEPIGSGNDGKPCATVIANDGRKWDYQNIHFEEHDETKTWSWDILGLRSHSMRSKSAESRNCTTSYLILWLMYFIDTKGRTDFSYPTDRSSNHKLFNEFEIVCAQAAKVGQYFPQGSITIELCNRKKQWRQQINEDDSSTSKVQGKGKEKGKEKGTKRGRTDVEQEQAQEVVQEEAPKRKKGKGGPTPTGKIDTAKWAHTQEWGRIIEIILRVHGRTSFTVKEVAGSVRKIEAGLYKDPSHAVRRVVDEGVKMGCVERVDEKREGSCCFRLIYQ